MCTCNDVIHVMYHLPYTYVMQMYTRTKRINSFHRTQERMCVRKLCVRERIANIHVHGTGERYQLANCVTTASGHVLWRDVLHFKSRRCQDVVWKVHVIVIGILFRIGWHEIMKPWHFDGLLAVRGKIEFNWMWPQIVFILLYAVSSGIDVGVPCTLPAHHSSASSIQKLNRSRFLLNITKHSYTLHLLSISSIFHLLFSQIVYCV